MTILAECDQIRLPVRAVICYGDNVMYVKSHIVCVAYPAVVSVALQYQLAKYIPFSIRQASACAFDLPDVGETIKRINHIADIVIVAKVEVFCFDHR